MNESWKSYASGSFFDELITPQGQPRAAARGVVRLLQKLPGQEMAERRAAAELAIREMGISFTVYNEAGNIDRAWPFDIIPRVISARQWQAVSDGLRQRSLALNHFIQDIYNQQKILADGVVPVDSALGYLLGAEDGPYLAVGRAWIIGGETVPGSWYRPDLFDPEAEHPWTYLHHIDLQWSPEVAAWIARTWLGAAGPDPTADAGGTEAVSDWR